MIHPRLKQSTPCLRDRFWVRSLTLLLAPAFIGASFHLSDMPPQIPIKNSYYTIQEIQDAHEPGILKFKVSAAHAVYEIQGFLPLEKLLREIEVIERVKRQEQDNGFLEGASDSVEGTVTGLGNLVAHPVDSAKGLGKAAGKLSRTVGGVFRKKEDGEKSSFGEKMMGGNQREIAKKIGADVYTRNPHLRSMIQRMASSRMGGESAVMVLKFIIPVAALASIAITAGGVNTQADQIVNDTSRGDLYGMNKKALIAMGFDEASVTKFLGFSALTPREQTYFRFYLDILKKTEGFGSIFQSVLDSKTEWEIYRKLYESQMASGASKKQYAKIWSYPEGLGILELSGHMIFITAYDQLDSDDLGNRVLARIRAMRNQNQVPVEIRNGGRITDNFRAQAQREKIRIKPWGFFENGEPNEKL